MGAPETELGGAMSALRWLAVTVVLLTAYTFAILAWRDGVCARRGSELAKAHAVVAVEEARAEWERAAPEQVRVVERGDKVRRENDETFQPLKEVVRYVEVDSGVCVGEFDPRVRDALQGAAAAANATRVGGVPPARRTDNP